MQYTSDTPEAYIRQLPEQRQEAIRKLRDEIRKNLPPGFEEQMSYGMIGYVVPHTIFPEGYHVNPSLPLPFINIASQKNHIAVYHMGIYADKKLLDWFVSEHKKITGRTPDMGKSCIRFRNTEEIPYTLIGELAAKMTPKDWITCYKNLFLRKE